MKFIASTLFTTILLPLLIRWGIAQANRQLEKMQDAAYDTPGAESPITPPVLIGTAAMAGGHFVFGSSVLGLKKRTSFLSLVIGIGAGIVIYFFTRSSS